MSEFKEGDRVCWVEHGRVEVLGYVAYVTDVWVGVIWDDTNNLEEYEIAVTPEIEATCEP